MPNLFKWLTCGTAARRKVTAWRRRTARGRPAGFRRAAAADGNCHCRRCRRDECAAVGGGAAGRFPKLEQLPAKLRRHTLRRSGATVRGCHTEATTRASGVHSPGPPGRVFGENSVALCCACAVLLKSGFYMWSVSMAMPPSSHAPSGLPHPSHAMGPLQVLESRLPLCEELLQTGR